mgnify:CR=1 FL=1
MLPTTITTRKTGRLRQSQFSAALGAVHSLGILAAQSDVCKGFYPEQSRHNDRQKFNTAIFLILTDFTTWMQLLYAQKLLHPYPA